MPAPNILEMLKGLVGAPLGAPILPVELEFSQEFDVAPALIEFYKYVPIMVGKAYSVFDTRELAVAYSTVLADFPDPAEMFYVGVMDHKIRHQIGQNAFNQNLLGLNVGVPIADPMENLQMATMIDISTGDTYLEEDPVRQEVRFTLGGLGTLSVIFAVGCWDVQRFPMRHLTYLAALVGSVYYERILSIRQTGTFAGSDFKISSDRLREIIRENQDQVKKLQEQLAFMAVTMG